LRLKILKKLRTASLNSEYTGSYKKSIAGFNLFTWSRKSVFFEGRILSSQSEQLFKEYSYSLFTWSKQTWLFWGPAFTQPIRTIWMVF